MEEGTQRIIDGQGQMQVGHFEQVLRDRIHPLIDTYLTAARTEPRLARYSEALKIPN